MKHRLIAVFLFIILSSCSGPENKADGLNKLREKDSLDHLLNKINAKQKAFQLDTLFKHTHKLKGFNGNVLVAQYGQVIYKNSFGYSDYKKKDSLKLNSAFQLASVSKQFGAAAIMLLKERGKLSYSDTLQKFFPKFPYKNITVRMLLTHRSGLPNYIYFCEDYTTDHDSPICNADVVNWMIEHKPEPYAKPNTKFNYCNTNYCLLAAIVEKVSGASFAEFLSENIFKPLQMNDTWISNPVDDTLRKNKTIGYNMKWEKHKSDYLDGVVGDKGVYSTVEDLFKYDRALYSEKLLKQSTIQEAYAPSSFEKKGKRNYGFGWRLINPDDSTKIVFHNGWWHGYTTGFFRRLNDQTCIIILGNKYNKSAYHVQGILDILSGSSGKGVDEEEGEE